MPASHAHAPSPEPGRTPDPAESDRTREGATPPDPGCADALEGLGALVEALLSCDW